MNIITREKAICMVYCEPYSKARSTDLLRAIEKIGLDVCYRDDPALPIILCVKSVDQNPYKNKRYHSESIANESIQTEIETQQRITNQAQLAEFLNTMYLPFTADNDDLYESTNLSLNEVFSNVLKITNIHDDKSVIGFTKWCVHKKLKLLEATPKRKLNEAGQKTVTRHLYVLKNKFVETALEDITMHLPRYQDNLKKMKEAGYEVIGYARKSKGEKDDMERIRLLNLMVEKLKTRSLADKVFVSPSSSAGDPFNERDEKRREDLMSHIDTNGDTQGKEKDLSFLLTTNAY